MVGWVHDEAVEAEWVVDDQELGSEVQAQDFAATDHAPEWVVREVWAKALMLSGALDEQAAALSHRLVVTVDTAYPDHLPAVQG